MADTEYISKEAALACFHDWIDRYGHEHTADEMVEYQRIEDLPDEDVRPVVRASWEDATGYIYIQLAQRVHCPVCKAYSYFHTITARNYCPSCGADMMERENAEEV